MDKFKKGFAFIFFMLAGIVLGAFLAIVCENQPYVYWMSWGKDLGIESFSVDLYGACYYLADSHNTYRADSIR